MNGPPFWDAGTRPVWPGLARVLARPKVTSEYVGRAGSSCLQYRPYLPSHPCGYISSAPLVIVLVVAWFRIRCAIASPSPAFSLASFLLRLSFRPAHPSATFTVLSSVVAVLAQVGQTTTRSSSSSQPSWPMGCSPPPSQGRHRSSELRTHAVFEKAPVPSIASIPRRLFHAVAVQPRGQPKSLLARAAFS